MPKTQLLWTSAESILGDRFSETGEVEKKSFFALPSKGGHSGLIPWKTVCPNLGGFGEEFSSYGSRSGLLIRMGCVQGLHSFNLASGGLLMSFSRLSNCSFSPEHLPFGRGFSSTEELKDIVMCIPWGGTRTLPQGCTIVSWLFLPFLCIPSLPWLATVERLPCPGAPEGSAQFQTQATGFNMAWICKIWNPPSCCLHNQKALTGLGARLLCVTSLCPLGQPCPCCPFIPKLFHRTGFLSDCASFSSLHHFLSGEEDPKFSFIVSVLVMLPVIPIPFTPYPASSNCSLKTLSPFPKEGATES